MRTKDAVVEGGIILAIALSLFLASMSFPQASYAESVDNVKMNRLYNPYTGEHFYTSSPIEKESLIEVGWRSEGTGWLAPLQSSVPVYRLYNPYALGGDHHYTVSTSERDSLVAAGWEFEGVGWYSDDERAVPLYRQYNPYASSGSHNYTTSRSESDSLVDSGWVSEDIAWYGSESGFKRVDDAVISLSVSCGGEVIKPVSAGGGDWRILLPAFASGSNTMLTFNVPLYAGTNKLSVDSGRAVPLEDCLDGPLGRAVSFCLYDVRGRVYSRIFVERSTEISSIFLTSEDPIDHGRQWVESSEEHSNSAKGRVAVIDSGGSKIYDGDLTQIRGRGNSSWFQSAKKSYQIKLAKKCDLLCTGNIENKAKTWTLITDNFDSTSLRNAIAYRLAQDMQVSSAVDSDFVDLYYDGDYQGTYLLCEKVQVNPGRVDIEDLESKNEDLNGSLSELEAVDGTNSYGLDIRYTKEARSPEDISGGYLIEHEQYEPRYSKEPAYFGVEVVDGYVQHFVCKSPDGWTKEEADYVSCLFQDVFDSCRNGGVVPTWRGSRRAGMTTDQLVDLNSLAKLYWVNELMKNGDGFIFSSTYIYKDSGMDSKLLFGPAWDFDLSSGNKNVFEGAEGIKNPVGWWTRESGIGLDLMRNPLVRKAVKDWKPRAVQAMEELLVDGEFNALFDRSKSSHLMDAFVWGSKTETAPMLRYWLERRMNWIEAQ